MLIITGRAALQKRIMPMLRRIEEPTQGNKQAWTKTYKIWTEATDFLQNFPRVDSSVTVKKRTSNQTSECQLEVRTTVSSLLSLLSHQVVEGVVCSWMA